MQSVTEFQRCSRISIQVYNLSESSAANQFVRSASARSSEPTPITLPQSRATCAKGPKARKFSLERFGVRDRLISLCSETLALVQGLGEHAARHMFVAAGSRIAAKRAATPSGDSR